MAARAAVLGTIVFLGVMPAGLLAQSEAPPVLLKAREFAFDPREITARAGEVVLSLTNTGGVEHALVLEDESHTALAEIPSVFPEKTEQIRVRLSAGTYPFFCPIGSGFHRRRGMVGVLKVTD